jgi:hypothetical protein
MDSIKTQYNPNAALNAKLLDAGASKTVYALTGSHVTDAKLALFEKAINRAEPGQPDYFDMFTEAWTGKQDSLHRDFFDAWHTWSSPVIDLDRSLFPHFYPTNGASEAIRQLIFESATNRRGKLHVFSGEYEGYLAMAKACMMNLSHSRDSFASVGGREARRTNAWGPGDVFWVSQPSAIDGNVWKDFNAFLEMMPDNSVYVDLTYVGAVPASAIIEKFNLNQPSVAAVVFSLSKPFGAYYDRIGGVFCRQESPGLFGNIWFKNLNSIALGTELLTRHGVFEIPDFYSHHQQEVARQASRALGVKLTPSDVYVLATVADPENGDPDLMEYIVRRSVSKHPDDVRRICLTPGMVNYNNFLSAR